MWKYARVNCAIVHDTCNVRRLFRHVSLKTLNVKNISWCSWFKISITKHRYCNIFRIPSHSFSYYVYINCKSMLTLRSNKVTSFVVINILDSGGVSKFHNMCFIHILRFSFWRYLILINNNLEYFSFLCISCYYIESDSPSHTSLDPLSCWGHQK